MNVKLKNDFHTKTLIFLRQVSWKLSRYCIWFAFKRENKFKIIICCVLRTGCSYIYIGKQQIKKYTDRSPNLFIYNTIQGRVGILVLRQPLLVDHPHFSRHDLPRHRGCSCWCCCCLWYWLRRPCCHWSWRCCFIDRRWTVFCCGGGLYLRDQCCRGGARYHQRGRYILCFYRYRGREYTRENKMTRF